MTSPVQTAVAKVFGTGTKFMVTRHAAGGFLSSVQFIWVVKPDGETHSVVFKAPDVSKINAHYDTINATDRPIDANFINAAHDNEAIFLNILLDFKQSTGELSWMPHVYAAETVGDNGTDGYIVMEDLSDRGTVPNEITPQPDALLKATVDALADLAYLSIARPAALQMVRPFTQVYDVFIPGVKIALAYLQDNYPEVFPAEPESILSRFSFKNYLDGFVLERTASSILVHRDMFPRNILVDKNDPSKFVSYLDWQLAGVGRPGEDLSRLLSTSLDHEERRASTESYLHRYYDAVREKCLTRGLDIPFSLEDVKAGYEGSFGYNTLLFCDVSSYCLQEIKGKVPEADCRRLVERCYGCVKDAFML